MARAPQRVWETINRFLYGIKPEFVDSVHFCAAARKRGYIHNLPIDDRENVLKQCRRYNFVGVGKNKVARLDHDMIEVIMGFPENHTSQVSKTTRYICLGNTIHMAYESFPFSGIGDVEVALRRLGLPLNFVVSVEKSDDYKIKWSRFSATKS
ncbi:hypothetical protein POM88_006167 [Heracleum sosnowskyi]|uniref:SAM-dependent MTase DRM-type domain-containing protein n=1 Tax=Heracleum sosnowskyi TaxID=360622 RepID=A0AAD8N4J0_9APIA|nr:hypothetical protein POM88_006166 [Heracleum sosnowskyi]KAK1396304.1 hypothetical protein POM88_006167 [Heracleum sosnowskyi]